MQLGLDLDLPRLRIAVLGSGSAGNAMVVESGGQRLLVDAGFSCRQLELRMDGLGIPPQTVSALLLTHEHGDHTRGARVFGRRYGVPVYATGGTLERTSLGEDVERRRLRSGRPMELDNFQVGPFSVPHDAAEPVGFVIEDRAGARVGLVADLGCRSQLAWGRLEEVDILVLETNHELEMLRNGPYPWPLKQRVAGRHGHLSNREAAEGLPDLLSDRLQTVVLYHLSRTNNRPQLAARRIATALEREGCRAPVVVTDQFQPTGWLTVGSGPREELSRTPKRKREEGARCWLE